MDEQFTTKFSPINYVDDAPMEENSDKLSDISSNLGSIVEGSIVNKKVSVIAGAINASGNFINDIINARLDTSAKTILGEFTFGVSGAIKMITDANNGLWISPTGILGKKAGATTFAITTTGDATFAGTLSAAAGTLGAITIGTNAWHVDSSGNMWWGTSTTYAGATIKISSAGSVDFTTGNFSGTLASGISITSPVITGGTIQTAASGARTLIDSNGLQVFNDTVLIGQIQTTQTGALFSSTSPNTASRMFQHINFVQAGSNSNPMVYLEAKDISTGTNILELQQRGDKEAIKITNYSTSEGNAINILYSGMIWVKV